MTGWIPQTRNLQNGDVSDRIIDFLLGAPIMLKLFGGQQNPSDRKKWKYFQEHATLVALGLVAVCAGWLFWRLITPRMDFYNELWGPAYLLVHGKSPYDTAALNPVLPAAWFPVAIGFFFPLGWLTELTASRVWFVFNILELCGIIYLAQGEKRSPLGVFALSLFCFFYPPVLNHLYLGQISITVAFCLVLAAYFAGKNYRWREALVVALAFSKPHLAILPVLGLVYYEYKRGGQGAVVSFVGKTFMVAIILSIPLFVAHPNWIPDAIASMAKNPFWLYPSLFVLYQRFFEGWQYVLWGITLMLILGAGWIVWNKFSVEKAMAWSLALAPLASPYVGSWDFVFSLPLFFQVFIETDWKRKVFLACSYVLAWYGMALVQIQPSSDNHFFWWVPLWFAATIALSSNWHARLKE